MILPYMRESFFSLIFINKEKMASIDRFPNALSCRICVQDGDNDGKGKGRRIEKIKSSIFFKYVHFSLEVKIKVIIFIFNNLKT